jgi:ABC-2 type transport system ATP-binding protein
MAGGRLTGDGCDSIWGEMTVGDEPRLLTLTASRPERERAVVIEVRDLYKTFRIPTHRIDSLKERFVHPLTRGQYRELRALRGVSFDVGQGEFFGIVGRNGSGKSTLLKIVSSIYRADSGRVRIAGRLAPFIELGVGFNPELTSRENVLLNGVMMGLSRGEARRRLDSVLEFAELTQFADLKLKNYSSGMMVRLAFAVMVEADADMMLIDEVLAVGDAAFGQKCMDVFREKRAAGRTIVLVTHDMSTVQAFCDRAMLVHDGELTFIGDPEEAALRYYRLNFGQADDGVNPPGGPLGVPDVNVRVLDAWIENARGERVTNVEQGEPIGLGVLIEARQELLRPVFAFHFRDVDGRQVFGFNRTLEVADPAQDRVAVGARVRISGRVENPLLPGRYFVDGLVARNRTQGDLALHPIRLLDFVVYGTEPGFGSVSVRADVKAVLESAEESGG